MIWPKLAPLACLLMLTITLPGCDDESDPVDIPFSGVEVKARGTNQLKEAEAPEASASAAVKTPSASRTTPHASAAARVSACCGALRSRAGKAKDEGERAVNNQAAAVCSQRASQVRVGKLTRAQALSQVRASLLGSAPGACR